MKIVGQLPSTETYPLLTDKPMTRTSKVSEICRSFFENESLKNRVLKGSFICGFSSAFSAIVIFFTGCFMGPDNKVGAQLITVAVCILLLVAAFFCCIRCCLCFEKPNQES